MRYSDRSDSGVDGLSMRCAVLRLSYLPLAAAGWFTRRQISQMAKAVRRTIRAATATGMTITRIDRIVARMSSASLTGTCPAPPVLTLTGGVRPHS